MTYNHAQEMEAKGYGYESEACTTRGLDRLFRNIDAPEECYELAVNGRKVGNDHFDKDIARIIFGDSVRPIPIVVGGEGYTLFEVDIPERLETNDLQSWKDLLIAARKHRLITLFETEEDHVQPYASLPNGNWGLWEFGDQKINLRGRKYDEMLAKMTHGYGGQTAEELWFEEMYVYPGGNRGLVLFPPEPAKK